MPQSADSRKHVVVVDRAGYDRYRMPDGAPVLDPAAYHVTLLAPPAVARQAATEECAENFAFTIDDVEMTKSVITMLHAQHPLHRVIAFPENLQLPVAEVRDRFGITGPSHAQVLPFRDKLTMKAVAAGHGLPVADCIPIEEAADVAPFLARHGRVFLKPRAGTGSAGVYTVNDQLDLDALAADRTVDLANYQAEQFIEAPMIHIDAVVHGGRPIVAVTSRYLDSTLVHLERSPLGSVAVSDPELLGRANELLAGVVDAFSVKDAVLHLEAFVAEELIFNEVAGRPGGGGIVPTVQALTGYNLFEAMVRMSLGESPTSSYKVDAECAGFVIMYGRPGVLASIEDGAIPTDWIVERKAAVRPGERFVDVGRAGGSFVTYVVRGRTEEQVAERIAIVRDTVRIHYADELVPA